MATWDFASPFDPAEGIPDDYVWERLRIKRNNDLAASDWTQVADAPVDKTAWANYRQALRDLPANTVDPRQANWPIAPAS